MKGLFCYDGPLKKDRHGNYYGIALNNDVFLRYFTIANNLTVAIGTKDFGDKEELKKYSRINLDNLRITSLPNIASLKGIIFNYKKLEKILIKEINKADFVIVRLPGLIGSISAKLAKKLNKPLLIEIVGCSWDAYWNHSLKGKIIAPYMYYITKSIARDSTHVLYVTNEFLQKRYPTNGEKVSCSNVTLKESGSTILDKRIKRIKAIDDSSKIVIGTIGAVDVKYKGHKDVIKAIGKLNRQGIRNYEYQLVGSGDRSTLINLAKRYDVFEQVKFLGTLPHNEVFSWLETIDIYIQPSKTEGLPRALIEAMSRGCPSIGSHVGGIAELLDRSYVYNISLNTADELCNKIKSLNKDSMIDQAKRNYKESEKYLKSIIDKRREYFYSNFKNSLR